LRTDKLDRVGERKAIRIISKILEHGIAPIGIGDDVAVIEMGDDYLLVTTDMITKSTHTPLATAKQIGWHLVAINLSDIGSKGGRPIGVVTALGLPIGTDIHFLKELTKGMRICAKRFDTSIIGGDTKESKEISLTGTAFGLVNRKNFMARKGARPGDIVAVTGDLGVAAAGLESLKRKIKRPKAIKALLEPVPRVREGISLGETGVVTSCMDISDGLSSSLYHLSRASRTGFRIEYGDLPISKEIAKVGLDEEDAVLHFGGEYELLMTIRPRAGDVEIARGAVEKHGCRFSVIGKVIEKGIFLQKEGKASRLKDLGWEHFRPVRKLRRAKTTRTKGQKPKRKRRN
jgi:thiamine-monophosphate kinase